MLQINGSVVNRKNVISAAKGFLLASGKTILQPYGWPHYSRQSMGQIIHEANRTC